MKDFMTKEWNSKIWNFFVLGLVGAFLATVAGVTAYIDPVFHYHAPLAQYSYPIDDERYMNDGLVTHLDYDAIIVGSSMSENFRTSEVNDQLGSANSLKACMNGASYRQIDQVLRKAFASHNDISFVIRNLDYAAINQDKDDILVIGGEEPEYLYDDNIFNDVNYLLNREMLFGKVYRVIQRTHLGQAQTSRDDYGFWGDDCEYGRNVIIEGYDIDATVPECQEHATDEELAALYDNFEQNVLAIIEEHPDTTFYIFFPPYGIGYWQMLYARGQVQKMLDYESYAIDLLLPYENVKLFGFNNAFDYAMITDLDNYTDINHYGPWVNSWMLIWMGAGECQITPENAEAYKASEADFFLNFDYSTTFEDR